MYTIFKEKVDGMVSDIISPFKKKFPMTSPFGERTNPITKKPQFHNGVDFATPKGTPVSDPFDGLVSTLVDKTNGNAMFVNNDKLRLRIGMAHLDSFVAKSGQTVSKGDLIAYTGNTGASTGPHIHYTVKDTATGKMIDPITKIPF